MSRRIAPLAAGLLAAGALGAPIAHAQTVQQTQQQLGLQDIPDPGQDPSPPADDAPDTDPADAPAPGEPPDPSDTDDPYETTAAQPAPGLTPAPTPAIAAATPAPAAAAPSPVAAAPSIEAAPATSSASPAATPATPAPPPAAVSTPAAAAPPTTPRPAPSARRMPHRRPIARSRRLAATTVRTRAQARPAALTTEPPWRGEYVVRAGDTLSGIAARLGTSWPALWAMNRDRVADPDLIYPGQRLRV